MPKTPIIGVCHKVLHRLLPFGPLKEELALFENQVKMWYPFIGPYDPCPPIYVKTYSTPPQLFIPFQPTGLPQFPPYEALQKGTLWPALFSPYDGRRNAE